MVKYIFMCSSQSDPPPDRAAALLRLNSPKPLVIARADDQRLINPPSLQSVLSATARFAPHYDEWMRESHHPKSIEMLRRYAGRGYLGDTIAEVGCGTGVLTANLMVSISARKLMDIVYGGKDMNAPTFICLDQSGEMLGLAQKNIATNMAEFIASAKLMGPGLKEEDFEIIDGKGEMALMYCGRLVAKVLFSLKEAKDISAFEAGERLDTVIIAYVMHWFRGIVEKDEVARKISEILPSTGTLISIEESPLVVRRDLHPDDLEILAIADMIQEATTPMTISEIHGIFTSNGLAPVPGAFLKKGIDEYHDMYGMAFRKP
jgi:SAM-dependent methyltransferase